MPKNKFQRVVFAFLTVLTTVHAYVFYSLYVINGQNLMEVNNAAGVLAAINKQGGVYMLGNFMPIWAVISVEFVLAFSLEIFMGSPCSFRLASKVFNPAETHPVLFETAIICATAGLMCPAMSFIAAWLYYPYYAGFKAIPHRDCAHIAPSDFSSDCTNLTQAGCRPSRKICARWRKICKQDAHKAVRRSLCGVALIFLLFLPIG